MKKYAMSPAVLMTYSLSAALVTLAIATAFGIYFGQSKLSDYALSANHAKIDTEVNEQNILNTRKLEIAMKAQRDNIARAAAVVADSKYYKYQDQMVNDLNQYATQAGITILSFDFTQATASKPGSASSTAGSGLKTVKTNLSLKSPLLYKNYYKFLRLIENNLTKMQVAEITLSNSLQNPEMVVAPNITVEIYVQ